MRKKLSNLLICSLAALYVDKALAFNRTNVDNLVRTSIGPVGAEHEATNVRLDQAEISPHVRQNTTHVADHQYVQRSDIPKEGSTTSKDAFDPEKEIEEINFDLDYLKSRYRSLEKEVRDLRNEVNGFSRLELAVSSQDRRLESLEGRVRLTNYLDNILDDTGVGLEVLARDAQDRFEKNEKIMETSQSMQKRFFQEHQERIKTLETIVKELVKKGAGARILAKVAPVPIIGSAVYLLM